MTKSHWGWRLVEEMEGEEVDEVGAVEVGSAEVEDVP
jgi:hypothetical protein